MGTVDAPTAVEISLVVDTIYGDAALRVKAVASGPFTLVLDNGRLVGVESGHAQPHSSGSPAIDAISSQGAWTVEAVVGEWLAWRVDSLPKRSGGTRRVEYSQRFFPYISSAVAGSLSVEGGSIEALGLQLAGGHRPLRHHPYSVRDQSGVDGSVKFSRLDDGWIWRFQWKRSSRHARIEFEIPVTTGAPTIVNLVGTVAYTLLVSLAGLGIAAAVAPEYVVVGLVLATIGALAGRWATIDRPHHLTLLAGIYLLAALLLAGWAVAVEVGRGWLLAGLVPLAFATYLLRMNAYFEAVGGLPPPVARPWARLSKYLNDERLAVRDRFREDWFARGYERTLRRRTDAVLTAPESSRVAAREGDEERP